MLQGGPSAYSALQTLNLEEALQTTLPAGIGLLTSVLRLQLCRNSKLAQLPDSISSLTLLQRLDVNGCSQLGRLPNSISSLTALQASSGIDLNLVLKSILDSS